MDAARANAKQPTDVAESVQQENQRPPPEPAATPIYEETHIVAAVLKETGTGLIQAEKLESGHGEPIHQQEVFRTRGTRRRGVR